MTTKARLRKSEAQANAEALERRAAPFAGEHAASAAIAWDARRREPQTLREAVRFVRQAYADEVPAKLHDGPDAIGEGGTPRMTAAAEGYLFGPAGADDAPRDAETGQRDLIGYYRTPFRATLERMSQGSVQARRYARIVSHITIGDQDPVVAAMSERAHPDDAKLVAGAALRAFCRAFSDIRIHAPVETSLREATAAA